MHDADTKKARSVLGPIWACCVWYYLECKSNVPIGSRLARESLAPLETQLDAFYTRGRDQPKSLGALAAMCSADGHNPHRYFGTMRAQIRQLP